MFTRVVKKCLNLTFKVNFRCQKSAWTINDVSVDPYPSLFWVDPHPFYCMKWVWIESNKKGYGLTETSLTVHTVYDFFHRHFNSFKTFFF